MNISPARIETLEPNQIFVFGSNLAGRHGAGAARQALEKFGATWGDSRGFTGRSYALPTKDSFLQTLPLEKIAEEIRLFEQVATARCDLVFLVTEIGCGLAGYAPWQIAPLFSKILPANIWLPESFRRIREDQCS